MVTIHHLGLSAASWRKNGFLSSLSGQDGWKQFFACCIDLDSYMLSCLNFINCNLKKELGQYPAILSSSLVHNSCNLNDTNQLEESCFTPASIVHVSNAQLDSLSVNMIVSIESPASGIQTLQMIKQWGYFLSYHDYLKSCTNTSLCAKPFI